MNESSLDAQRLDGALLPAAPVPFRIDGTVDWDAQDAYVQWMAAQPCEGVAVWVHTGRGLYLDGDTRQRVLTAWREAMPDRIVVAGVGADPKRCQEATDPVGELHRRALEMADDAVEGGADALLVFPPTLFRHDSDRDARVLAYHRTLAETGVPLILFHLYEAAGGIGYGLPLLDQLLALPNVVGIKMATLDSVVTFQDVSRFILERHPNVTVVTGEDRFFGYTLMRGARAALIGLASACTRVQRAMMDACFEGRAGDFLTLSERVDWLAEATFIDPMEGYIRRMLEILVLQGVLPPEAANDPFGPELPPEQLAVLREVLEDLGEL